MDFTPITDLLIKLWAPSQYVLIILGALVVIGTALDNAIPDSIDKGFMKKIYSIPLLGDFLKFITKFSPFKETKKD